MMRPLAPIPPLGRRATGLTLLSALVSGPARAQAVESVTILAPGPEEGEASRWATRAAAALTRGFHRPVALRVSALGGPDGVTAANRFATLDGGNGRTFLALPGATCHARLTGASRARFQPGTWLPLLMSWHNVVLAGRGPLPARGAEPLRVAIPAPDAPEAAALAALDLLGLPARPVPGQPELSFTTGQADVLLVTGPDASARALALGATPWYQQTAPEAEASEIPSLPAASPAARGVLAAFGALQMRAALVMPLLTSADTIAAWRRAASRWQEEERALPVDGQALVGTAAAAAFALLAPAPDAVLSYRNWLEQRLGWRAN
ncbi:hypothetical protein [Roseomonas chloroacetimidivorans]|uniref:hypothetical protein n=1 Tax=Roseomonas chloroacetimidivorans TaxID=1766656 RepID=UPI003C76F9E1